MNMNLSDFLKTKQLVFNNGKVEVINNLSFGEIEFYELTADKINEIKTGVIEKLNDNYDKELFLFDILPFICSVNRDITFEQFKKLVSAPSVQFTYFLESIIDIVNNLFDLAERAGVLNNKVNDLKARQPELLREETLEEKIIRLTKEMNDEKDSKKKKVLLLQLAELYEKVENNG